MDSKLVVEQMSGELEDQAPRHEAAGAGGQPAGDRPSGGTTYTWVPREQNKHADRLANEALDGGRDGVTLALDARTTSTTALESARRGSRSRRVVR